MILIHVSMAWSKDGQAELCPGVVLREGEFQLNKNEAVLVCGDSSSPAWRQIPRLQSQLVLQSLLQKSGYFSPKFEIQNDVLYLELGPRTLIREWDLSGHQAILEKSRKRKVIKNPMTSAKLDEIEKWIELELKSRGYACPQYLTKARVWDESVESRYETGPQLRVLSIRRDGMENLDEETFRRYEAFDQGDVYDIRKLQISSNRLMADGLAQSSYYTQECTPEGVALTHHLEIGQPRLLRFGIGASTEELPFVDVTFRNTRLDGKASSYWILLHASPRLQSLEGSSEFYIWPWADDIFIGPRFRAARDIEESFEVLSGRTGVDVGKTGDWAGLRLSLRGGPTVNYINTIRGIGPDDISFVSAQGQLSFVDHDYELSIAEQFKGYQGFIQYLGQRKGLGSPVSAERWTLRGKHLWNMHNVSPPLFVLANRVELNVTTADLTRRGNEREALPQEYRIFLGGEQSLRGFARQAINNQGLGFLTSAYWGLELRLIEQLPWNLEPLLLWDGAKTSNISWQLAGPTLQSYGAGLRWRSPLGPVRATAARGQITHGDEASEALPTNWNYYFSFGREF